MSKENEIGKNWDLHYRKIYEPKIKRLTERFNQVYDENQRMKERLQKYESRRMIGYYNKKDKDE
jgi:hypothetical protein